MLSEFFTYQFVLKFVSPYFFVRAQISREDQELKSLTSTKMELSMAKSVTNLLELVRHVQKVDEFSNYHFYFIGG